MAKTLPTQDNRLMAVTTPLGKDVLLLEGFSGSEGLSQLFNYQLDLLAVNEKVNQVKFENVLGKRISVRLNLTEKGSPRFFNGICCRFSEFGRDIDFTSYRMELMPLFWLLTRRAQSRIFQRKTVKEILTKVFDDMGIKVGPDLKFDIDESGTLSHPRDYCVQYRETDFNFASRLMEEEGIYYFFVHSANAHQMVVSNKPTHPDVQAPKDIKFEERASGVIEEGRISDWTKMQSLRSGAVLLQDHCFELISGNKPPIFQDLKDREPIKTDLQVGAVPHKLKLGVEKVGDNDKLELYDYPGEYAQRFDGVDRGGGDQPADLGQILADGKRTAQIRIQEEALASLVVSGVSNSPQLASGHTFKLSNHHNGNGEYVLTSVQPVAADQSYRSGEGGTFTYRNNFSCIPVGLPFRPPRLTAKPVVLGTQTAVVVGTGAKDEEFLVDKFGRVKVQFHWDRPGPQNADPNQATFKFSSCWVRVAQPWAGKRWGASFWPRIGQEVVVAFLEGDPDQPIIVGSVYNADQMPPYLGDGLDAKHKKDPKVSGIKTNTTPGGKGFNELRFDDTKDKEEVFIHAQRDMDVRVRNESRERVISNRHLVVGFKNEDDDGDFQKGGDQRELVNQDKHLNVKRDQVEKIEGNMQLTVGKGEASAGGNVDIVIEKDKKELIEKNSHLHVKEDRSEKVDKALSITVGGDRLESIGCMSHLHVKGDRNEKVDGTGSLQVNMDQQEKVGMSYALDAGMNVHIKAGMTLILEAGMQLSLKVGGNFVDLSPAGVAINGAPMLMLNSGGAAGSGAGSSPKDPKDPAAPQDAKEAKPTAPDQADNSKSGVKSAP